MSDADDESDQAKLDRDLRRLFVSPERAKRGDIEVEAREATPRGFVFRHGARAVCVIDRLHRRGQLTDRQADAARRLYVAYAVGIRLAHDREAGSGSGMPAGYSDLQLDEARLYRRARDRVGGRLWPILHAAVCEDMPVAEIAREMRDNPTAVMALLRLGLDMLADCLDEGT